MTIFKEILHFQYTESWSYYYEEFIKDLTTIVNVSSAKQLNVLRYTQEFAYAL